MRAKFVNFFANLFNRGSDNYWVMETDYDRYALVMYCSNRYLYKNVFAWIMIRDQNFMTTLEYSDIRNRLGGDFNLELDELIENDFTNGLDCDYDYLEYF